MNAERRPQSRPLKIGNVTLNNPFFLAPMAGVTDWPFRLLCAEQGAGLVYTEMVNARALCRNDSETLRIAMTHESERPCAIQIFGHEPDIMAEAVSILAEKEEYAIIDINMGCPAPKIVKNGDGSALMTRPQLAYDIMKAAVASAQGKKPVTVKLRKGWSHEAENYLEFGKMAEDAGISAVTLHGRTRAMFYSGISDWESVAKLKAALKIPVIGNGDIKSLLEAVSKMEEAGCDAVMIGRAARGNPWIFDLSAKEGELQYEGQALPCLKADITEATSFAQISASSNTPHMPQEARLLISPHARSRQVPELPNLLGTISRHYAMMVEYKGERTATLEMRKHLACYLHGRPNAAKARSDIYKCESIKEVMDILAAHV